MMFFWKLFLKMQTQVIYYLYQGSGLAYHVTDIYFEICEEITPNLSFERFTLFENLLKNHHI
jgi:hypothetical protein